MEKMLTSSGMDTRYCANTLSISSVRPYSSAPTRYEPVMTCEARERWSAGSGGVRARTPIVLFLVAPCYRCGTAQRTDRLSSTAVEMPNELASHAPSRKETSTISPESTETTR